MLFGAALYSIKMLVPGAGIEPARGCPRGILSPLRLPIPPPGRSLKGWGRDRTGVHGFAGRCITTLPPSHRVKSMKFGAGNESRTRDLNLGKVALYQLSYSRFPL